MASGNFNGSGSYVSLRISWSSVAGTGGSTVTATLTAVNQTYYHFYATVNRGYSITINGSTASGSTASLSSTAGGSANLISHSVWVGYTGNKSITISGYADLSNITVKNAGAIGARSVSGTAVLDKVGSIPPDVTMTAPTTSTISETGGTVTLKWNRCNDYSGAATYRIQVSINGGAYSTIKENIANATLSYNYTIPAGQGNSYRFRIDAKNDIGANVNWGYSGTVTTNKLNSPSIGNIATYNPYVNSTLTVPLSGGSQTNGSTFKRMCSLYYGSTWLWEASYSSLSNGNTSVPISYAASNYLSRLGVSAYSSGNFRIVAWIQNANGSRSGYVEKYFTVNINTDGGATPTLAAPTLSGGAFNYPSTCFISGVSILNVKSATAVTRRAPSGTSVSYSISCTGGGTQNYPNASFDGLSAGIKEITVTATDSRGLSTSVTKYCRVQSWSKPTVSITSCDRDSTNTSTAQLIYSVSYSPIYSYATDINVAGTQLNGITSQEYNINNGTWTTANTGMIIENLNTELTYSVVVRANDKVATSEYGSDSATIYTIKPILAMRSYGVGINCVPQLGHAFEVTGKTMINGDVVISQDSKQTDVDGKAGIFMNSTYGGIELSGATPFVDFHLDNSTTNYTARILQNSSGFNFYSSTGIHWYTGNSAKHAWIDSNGHMSVQGNITATGTVTPSDSKIKYDFQTIDKAKDFIMSLEPVSYKFKNGDSGRIHMGFIAQDVAKVSKELDMGDLSIYQAGVIQDDSDEEGYYVEGTPDEKLSWKLSYSDFIAPMVATIQDMQKEIDELKDKLKGGEANASNNA